MPKEGKVRDVAAFKSPLERLPLGSGLFKIGDNENYIVREADFHEGSFDFMEKLTLEECTKFFKDHLKELAGTYGISVVPAQFVIAPVNTYKKEELFILAEKVTPITEPAQELENQKRDLLGKILNYYEQKFMTREIFMWDIIHLRQYVYGTTSSNPEPQYYLTDLDPYFSRSLSIMEEDSVGKLKDQLLELQEEALSKGDTSYDSLVERVEALMTKLVEAGSREG